MPASGAIPLELLPAASLRFSGLRNLYRRDGFGAEFVAVLPTEPYAGAPTADAPEAQYTSITALLRFEGETLEAVMQTRRLDLLLFDPYRSTQWTLGGQQVPLAANFTAGYGLWLARSGFARESLRALLGRAGGIGVDLFSLPKVTVGKLALAWG
jgi:hypothetical protein